MNETKKIFKEKKRRNIWSKEEDYSLLDIVKGRGIKNWDDIANLHNKANKTTKAGKQCRERYRNYIKQGNESGKWSQQEKLAFILLHKIYGNQWSHLSKYLKPRNDISIKNYYYSLIRKAIKHFKSKAVLPQLLRAPEKLFRIYSMLELVKQKYVPALCGEQKLPKRERAEKIILDLLKDSGATSDSIAQYQILVVEKFKEFHSNAQFPLIIKVDYQEAGISKEKANELKDYENLFSINDGLLKGIVKFQFAKEKIKKEEEENKLPAHSEQSSIINYSMPPNPFIPLPSMPYYQPYQNRYPFMYPHIPFFNPYCSNQSINREGIRQEREKRIEEHLYCTDINQTIKRLKDFSDSKK